MNAAPPPSPLPQGEGESCTSLPLALREGVGGRARRTRTIGVVTAIVILAADQISKWWVLNVLDLPRIGQIVVLPVLDLTMVWNRGVTFGMLNGLDAWGALIIALIALAIVAALAIWLWRATSLLTAVAIGAIAGGAIGNVMDRLRHGAVVDFIHAHAGDWSWYVFNVGDAAIVCGVIALIVESQWPARRHGAAPGQAGPATSCDLRKQPPHG